jgi:hypothetical protein
MKARLWISLFATAFLALTSCATFGQGNGHGKGNGKDKDKDDRASDRVEFKQHDRDSMNEWYREHQHALPPGLAKRDQLPPGLEKQLQERGTLPPGLQKRIQPVPEDLETRLAPPPEGCRHVIIGGDVVLLNVRTNYVYSVVHFEIQ